MPYVFAHHFSGQGTAEALALYRSQFRPSAQLDRPRTFLTVNAVVADTAEEAQRIVHLVEDAGGWAVAPHKLVGGFELPPGSMRQKLKVNKAKIKRYRKIAKERKSPA